MVVEELFIVSIQVFEAPELVFHAHFDFERLHALSELSKGYTVVIVDIQEAEGRLHVLESLVNSDPYHL